MKTHLVKIANSARFPKRVNWLNVINLAAIPALNLLSCTRCIISRVWLYHSSKTAKVGLKIRYMKKRSSRNNHTSQKKSTQRIRAAHAPASRSGIT